MTDSTELSKQIARVRDMIKEIRVCMLTTEEADGSLRSRPMATREADFDLDLYFFTSDVSPKVQEIQQERQVNVSYSSYDKQIYVSVAGSGQIIHDKAKMAALWSPVLKAWFPDGLETPDICLLKVNVSHVEYWDAPSSKIVQAIGMAAAAVSGKPYDAGDHGRIEVR